MSEAQCPSTQEMYWLNVSTFPKALHKIYANCLNGKILQTLDLTEAIHLDRIDTDSM